MVLLFWGTSILNNYALGFNIPMTVHIIFRSLSLLVSMLNGYAFFGRLVTKSQLFSILLVTFGVIIYTFAAYSSQNSDGSVFAMQYFNGLGILTIAMILSSFLGQYQQNTYEKYGKYWKEGLFYTHALPLIGFGLFYSDLKNEIIKCNASPLISVGYSMNSYINTPLMTLLLAPIAEILQDVYLPRMWLYLVINCITQCKIINRCMY